MKLSYQELIMAQYIQEPNEWNRGVSAYELARAIKDCFAISRIQSEIGVLSHSAWANEKPRIEMAKQYDKLEKILLKYPNAIDGQTGT